MNGKPEISVAQGIITLSGELNSWTVGGLFNQLKTLELQGASSIDCSAIRGYDSAAIAFFIYLIRVINVEKLKLIGDQGGLISLATLYGVDEFFLQ